MASGSLPGKPVSGRLRGIFPQTHLVGTTAAVVEYNAVSLVIAAVAARWLGVVRLGYFEAIGMVAPESCIQVAIGASAQWNTVLAFELEIE